MYFPEIQRFWHNNASVWLFEFLQDFPTAHSISSLTCDEFIEKAVSSLFHKKAKGRILAEIHLAATQIVGMNFDINGPGVIAFKLQLRRYVQLHHDRNSLAHMAEDILQDNNDYKILRSVPGIGPITALAILAEAGDLRRFKHYKQFLNYCGLALSKSQSGHYRGKEQLSKRGNARLRLAFWMAAQTAIRDTENSFREKFRRYIAADPLDKDLRRKGYVAVAAKMARVVYGLIKSDTLYQKHFETALPSGTIPLRRAVEAKMTS
jgi:transposase